MHFLYISCISADKKVFFNLSIYNWPRKFNILVVYVVKYTVALKSLSEKINKSAPRIEIIYIGI